MPLLLGHHAWLKQDIQELETVQCCAAHWPTKTAHVALLRVYLQIAKPQI